jgi:branched-chain amino acid aminotransferase
LREHIQRLEDSCKVYRMPIGYSVDELIQACLGTVRVNEFKACYLRPIIFRGYGSFGVNPFANPVEVYIASWTWGKYLGQEAIEEGVDVCVASWARMHPEFPARDGQVGGQLYELAAHQDGGHYQRLCRRYRTRHVGQRQRG